MDNMESDYIFLVETENEDKETNFDGDEDKDKDFDGDEDKDFNGDEDEDTGKDCYSSIYADNDPHSSNPNSLDPSWPRSYRKSMDLYGRVASSSLNFLGSSNLSLLGGSFLSSSPNRRCTSKTLTSLDAHLLLPQEYNSLSDHSLPKHSRGSSAKRLLQKEKSPQTGKISFGQAVVNGVNLLCGVGLLSTPYAVKQGGWAGLSILSFFCVVSFYTGILLRCCLDSKPGLQSYPDIGQAAFGIIGRLVVSIALYVELYASCVEFIILESDNLSSLFPYAHLNLGGYQLSSHYLFAIIITLIVLPSVWLRDMSVLSYLSACGVFVTILLVICLFWVGLVDSVGFQTESTTILNISTLPVSIGLYGYCYAGHAVLPNIYMSMEKKSQYPLVLLACFTICTLLYAGVAVLGYMMFGESTESQFTLNLPKNLFASKIAVWATVFSPLTKYALTISPVALSLEELIPLKHQQTRFYSILIRTTLVISTLLVGLSIPFFGLVLSLIGSLLTMLVSLIFPCACFLRLLKGKITRFQGSLCVLTIAIGIISSVFGTYTALSKIIQLL
ncbi:putative amino acid transporter, transmembrane domain-containing protein [Helianthus annuus]|uniref:amino acid transporter AVT1C n=1 Tax=Helianthus annuus TaxID=4232 RepID=UPI000B8F3C17|nr:amino acid transporter AVT1C [Helianthus annuus]KAJ0721772.1 putative amino acid transporter, transmembrane domain-containing protein [Helianthus annuus]